MKINTQIPIYSTNMSKLSIPFGINMKKRFLDININDFVDIANKVCQDNEEIRQGFQAHGIKKKITKRFFQKYMYSIYFDEEGKLSKWGKIFLGKELQFLKLPETANIQDFYEQSKQEGFQIFHPLTSTEDIDKILKILDKAMTEQYNK